MSPPDFVKPVVTQLHRLEELMQREEYDEAITLLRQAKSAAQRAGASSPWVEWQLCVALDLKGDAVEALAHINEALRLDPVAPHNHSSRDIVLRHLRAALCAEGRDLREPEVALLYRAVVDEDAADGWCHLTFARHHLACGRSEAALRILDALEVLFPSFAPAAALKVEALVAAGRSGEVEDARTRARVLAASRPGLPVEATQPEAAS